MARKKKNEVAKAVEQIKKLLPKGVIPDSYLEYVVTDNKEFCDSPEEWMAEVKMQLFEESGCDLPLTRDEADNILFDEMNDEQWEVLSKDGMISASQVKMIEDSSDKTMLELIREMPLIPAARILGSIVISHLRGHGIEVDEAGEEEITDSLIHSLNTSFSDMTMQLMGMDPTDLFSEDLSSEDALDTVLPFKTDWDSPGSGEGLNHPEGIEHQEQKKEQPRQARRSRITKFPGK